MKTPLVARRGEMGLTLIELMMALFLVGVGFLGLMGTYKYLTEGSHASRGKSLASNLAGEKIESLKNSSYYRLLVTTTTTTDTNFSPAIVYDVAPNGSETIEVGGIQFYRRVYIHKVTEDASKNLMHVNWDQPDTSLKEVVVYVVWQEKSEWKKLELRNVRDNPDREELNATFSGSVTENGSGTPLVDAVVQALQNTSRYDDTGAGGAYSFVTEAGSYTLRASKVGYFEKYSPTLSISANQTVAQNFPLVKMDSGTINGTVYLVDHLVISQVVGSTYSAASGMCQEYVELFNPTTSYVQMVLGWNADQVSLKVQNYADAVPITLDLDYSVMDASVPPSGYFLIANTSPVVAVGVSRTADAVFNSGFAGFPNLIRTRGDALCGGNEPDVGDGDSIGIAWTTSGVWIDQVGWSRTTGLGHQPPMKEGTAIPQGNGFEYDEQYVRLTSPSGVTSGQGRAYDSGDNSTDFNTVGRQPMVYPPRNRTDTETVVSGTPAGGAIVGVNDGLSASGAASLSGSPPTALFSIPGVATGTWTVYASSGLASASVGLYGGYTAGFSTTTPTLFLTSTSVTGYITGRVTNTSGGSFANVLMEASGVQTRTNSSGDYTLASSTGVAVTVTANSGYDLPNYVQASAAVAVNQGQLTSSVDFTLAQGGQIQGWITTNGVDPLPSIPVNASQGGVERGSGLSNAAGIFQITRLSTGSYVVSPQLDVGESASPSSTTVTVTAGSTVSAGTFTVSGAMGYIAGNLTTGSLAGPPITTGVLIYATTTTITSTPPTISSTTRSGPITYYASSGQADGTYRLAVRGGFNYNIYAWHTTWTVETSSTTRKESTNVAVAAGASVTRDFYW